MSYRLYTTDALVVGASNYGEGNRMLQLYTREFGFISAYAQSVRMLASKLRHHLQVGMFTEVTLVRGREMWRVTGARSYAEFRHIYEDGERRALLMRVLFLLRRMVHGEEKDAGLFDDIVSGLAFVRDEIVTGEDIKDAEMLLVARLMHQLGYLEKNDRYSVILPPNGHTIYLINFVRNMKNEIALSVNTAIRASQL